MTDALRHALVEAGRELVAAGLSPGTSGNISACDGDRVLMSPTNVALDRLDPDALAVLDLGGAHQNGPKPSKEFPLHRAFYRRDARFEAVVHLHSAHAVAASCVEPWHPRSAVPPITPYFVMRVGQTPLIRYASPGDPRQAADIEALDFPVRAALLANHGSVVAHGTIEQAVSAAAELEEACKLLALTAGRRPNLLDAAEARALADKYGSPWTVEE